MASIKDTVQNLLDLENTMTGADCKVANFAYTDKAYNDNIMAGTSKYDYSKDQNVPVGTAKGTDSNVTTLTKGYRAMGSSVSRMIFNHFFGRCSYNLNKIHDWFKTFLTAYKETLKGSILIWNKDTNYSTGEYCFTYLNKGLRMYKALQDNNGKQPAIEDGSIWELMNASWDLRETGAAIPTSGNTSMDKLIWPATYKNLRLTGIAAIPKEITAIEQEGGNSYSTVIIERGPGFVKQYIYYVNPSTVGGDQSGHYLIIRGGLLADDGQSVTNWTEWEFRAVNANNSDALGTLLAKTWESQVEEKVTNGTAASALMLENNAVIETVGPNGTAVVNRNAAKAIVKSTVNAMYQYEESTKTLDIIPIA